MLPEDYISDMDIGDDKTEAHSSSPTPNSVEFGSREATVSPEDVAWADSCLVKDPEGLDNNWDDVKDALLETLGYQLDSASQDRENTPECDDLEIDIPNEGTKDGENPDKAGIGVDSEPSEPIESDNFWSLHNRNDVFLPTYDESSKDLGTFDPDDDFVLQSLALDQLADDIFNIWNLDIPPEEDELVNQLNKALTESSSVTNSVSDDFNTLKEWKVPPLNDLISGIQDLSLSSSKD